MNQLLVGNDLGAFDKALPASRDELALGEFSLSGTVAQPANFLNPANQFGANVVQFAVKPVTDGEPAKISKGVLASLAGDPDPVKTLADIRALLVGPTRSLHNAMFEEMIDILEESDREVQKALKSLESGYHRLSGITDDLVTASVESRDHNRQLAEMFQKELQKSVAGQQEMLSEMFMAIDAKITELTARIDRKAAGLANAFEAAMRDAAVNQERASKALEARCLASGSEALDHLETRLSQLEKTSSAGQAVIREVFADGLLTIADRFKTLQQG